MVGLVLCEVDEIKCRLGVSKAFHKGDCILCIILSIFTHDRSNQPCFKPLDSSYSF